MLANSLQQKKYRLSNTIIINMLQQKETRLGGGARGRQFESGHPDKTLIGDKHLWLFISYFVATCFYLSRTQSIGIPNIASYTKNYHPTDY